MPIEHPRAQIEGTGIELTRASLGSDGTLGGFGGGDTTTEGCAQAVTSGTSRVSVSAQNSNFFSAISGLLVKCGTPRGFGGAKFGRGLGCLFADIGQHHGVVGVHSSFSRAHTRQMPPAGQGQQGGDQAGDDVGADGDHAQRPRRSTTQASQMLTSQSK